MISIDHNDKIVSSECATVEVKRRRRSAKERKKLKPVRIQQESKSSQAKNAQKVLDPSASGYALTMIASSKLLNLGIVVPSSLAPTATDMRSKIQFRAQVRSLDAFGSFRELLID
jgi:hypothetical protein